VPRLIYRGDVDLTLDLVEARVTLTGDGGEPRWSVRVDPSALRRACFREAFLWQPAGVACVGAAEHVWLFDLASGALRMQLNLNDFHPSAFSQFGHFGHAALTDGTDLLFVLSYTDVIALDASLSIRWIARDVAIDGLTGAHGCALDDVLIVHAEMDPPGGWFDVALDARTGRELGRALHVSLEHIAADSTGSPET